MNQLVPIMWKNVLFTMWFPNFVTDFNQSYNCQTSHYLGRNRLPNACLIVLSYLVFGNDFTRSLFLWKVWPCFFLKSFAGNFDQKLVLMALAAQARIWWTGLAGYEYILLRTLALKSLLVSIIDWARELHISITLRMFFKIRIRSSSF